MTDYKLSEERYIDRIKEGYIEEASNTFKSWRKPINDINAIDWIPAYYKNEFIRNRFYITTAPVEAVKGYYIPWIMDKGGDSTIAVCSNEEWDKAIHSMSAYETYAYLIEDNKTDFTRMLEKRSYGNAISYKFNDFIYIGHNALYKEMAQQGHEQLVRKYTMKAIRNVKRI